MSTSPKKFGHKMRDWMDRLVYVDKMKCIAIFLVFGVHCISLHGGWTSVGTSDAQRVFALMLYFICDCCVPLFFMATGILLNRRTVSWKGHFVKIIPVMCMYLYASLFCGLYKFFIEGQSVEKLLVGVGTFDTAGYGWYVKYYILLKLPT